MGNKVQPSSFLDQLQSFEKKLGFKNKLKWKAIIFLAFYHMLAAYWSFYYAVPAKWQTIVFALWMYIFISGCGITCGVHRFWTHRSYKATLPLRIWLMICFASTGQNSIYNWVRDHRLHHKFSDTEADPHNANRGFWFSHIGWLMMKKNSQVLEKGKLIDMSDIRQDPVAMFERKYSNQLSIILCYLLPTLTGILLWNETWQCAVAWQCFIRVLLFLHAELTVNSFAHMYGYKPYDKNILPTQNFFVSFVTSGEGWHNYHHVFPYDYKAKETFDFFGLSTLFIRMCSKLGLAYDLKEASPQTIQAIVKKNEDFSLEHEPLSDQ